MAVCASPVRMKDGHLSTPVQGHAEVCVDGGSGRETESYFSTLCKSCWCQRTMCVFWLFTDRNTICLLYSNVNNRRAPFMNMLIISVYGVIRWKANLQASAYSASQRPSVAVLLNSVASSLSKYQNKSGLICSDAEQVLLSHFLSTSQFHFPPNSCVQVTRACCEVGPEPQGSRINISCLAFFHRWLF